VPKEEMLEVAMRHIKRLEALKDRDINLDLRNDIQDIFLDLKDDGYDIKYYWIPEKGGSDISSANYPSITICKLGLKRIHNYRDDFKFSSNIVKEYALRLKSLLGDECDVYISWIVNYDNELIRTIPRLVHYIVKSGETSSSIQYEILLVRQ
jgi:hypothetical protein